MTDVGVNRIAMGAGIQISIRFFCAALGALSWAILTRKLGPADFGVFSIILSLLSVGQNVSDFGTTAIGVREMAQRPEDRGTILAALIGFQFVMGFAFFVILVVVDILIFHTANDRLTGVVTFFSLPIGAVAEYQSVVQARLRPDIAGYLLLFQSVVLLVIVGILAATHASLVWYGVGWMSAGGIQSVFTWFVARHLVKIDWRGWVRQAINLLRQSILFGISIALFLTYYKIDAIILFHYKGATISGYYGAAYRFIDVVQFIPVTIGSIVTPVMSMVLRGRGPRKARQSVYGLAIVLVTGTGGLIAVGGVLFRYQLVDLMYGSAYRQSAELLGILILLVPPLSIGFIITGIVNAGRKVLGLLIVSACMTVINIVANMILIPRYGATAAAWTAVGTEWIVAISLAVFVGITLRLRYPFIRSIRMLGAIGATAIVGIFAHRLGLFIGGTIVVITFSSGSIIFGGVRLGELKALIRPGQTIAA